MAVPIPRPYPSRIRTRTVAAASRAWLVGAAVAVSITTGVVAGISMPRGPVTTAEALVLLGLGVAAGAVAGSLMASRWAMLVAPLAHLAAFEVVRLDETGPTVDTIDFGSTFGILTFLVGRGVYLLVGLAPMAVGAAWGASLARWKRREYMQPAIHARDIPRHLGGGFATAALIALAIWIVIPASVPAVTGPDGKPIDGSVAELTAIDIDGNRQWLEIRGASADLPVLLYLSGGPGQSDLALSRVLLDDLTQDFLVVGWDQRGNGKSYADWEPETMTLDRAVADTIAVADYLRDRFDEERVYVLGESWGTTLAVLAAQEAPDRFHALISSGQMVSQQETDRRIYHDLLAWAEANGDAGLADTLRGFGEPPYDSALDYGFVMGHYPKLEGDYDPPAYYTQRGEAESVGFWGMMGSEYAFIDKANLFRGLIDTFDVLYPQLQGVDFREDVPALEVPIWILDGEHEIAGRRDLAHEWYAQLDAPHKEMITFADGGHAVAFEHFRELHTLLTDDILPATYPDLQS